MVGPKSSQSIVNSKLYIIQINIIELLYSEFLYAKGLC